MSKFIMRRRAQLRAEFDAGQYNIDEELKEVEQRLRGRVFETYEEFAKEAWTNCEGIKILLSISHLEQSGVEERIMANLPTITIKERQPCT